MFLTSRRSSKRSGFHRNPVCKSRLALLPCQIQGMLRAMPSNTCDHYDRIHLGIEPPVVAECIRGRFFVSSFSFKTYYSRFSTCSTDPQTVPLTETRTSAMWCTTKYGVMFIENN